MLRSKSFCIISLLVAGVFLLPQNVHAADKLVYVRVVNAELNSQEAYDEIIKKVVANLGNQGRSAKVARYKLWDSLDGTYFYFTPIGKSSDVEKVKQVWGTALAQLSEEDRNQLGSIEEDAQDMILETQKQFAINMKSGQLPPDDLQFAIAQVIQLKEGKHAEGLEMLETTFDILREAEIDTVMNAFDVPDGLLANNMLIIGYMKSPLQYERSDREIEKAFSQSSGFDEFMMTVRRVSSGQTETELILRGDLSFPDTGAPRFDFRANKSRSQNASNEASAIGSLRTIVTAEAQFIAAGIKDSNKDGKYEYGTLQEMATAKPPFIDKGLATGAKRGYTFIFKLNTDKEGNSGYTVSAIPDGDKSASRSFFIDNSGILTWSADGEPATKDSPPLQ